MHDQTIKHDADKWRPTTVPPAVVYAISQVREYGIGKYGAEEAWRDVEPSRYMDALLRHTLARVAGEVYDEESGLPHTWHMACNVAFLVALEIAGGEV